MQDTSIAEEHAIATAIVLAQTPSESGHEASAVQLVTNAMRDAGFDRVTVDLEGNAVGLIGSGGEPRLLIDGHLDSIPLHSENLWTVDPFGAIVKGGRLYGLGICDQKASLAAAIYGVAAARDAGRLSGTVAVIGSVCEEDMEGTALRNAVESFEPNMAITTEPSNTRLCLGHRGRAKLDVVVTGRPCHSGRPQDGINAAEALAALIVGVSRLPVPVHKDLGRRHLTFIDFSTSPYPSVSTVPGVAIAHLDCRLLPGETPASLCTDLLALADIVWHEWPEQPSLSVTIHDATFTTWNGITHTVPEFAHAWATDPSSPFVQVATSALLQAGLDPGPTYYSFCTNGSLTAGEFSVPTIGFGVGMEELAHQVDEYVTLDSIRAGVRGFAALVRHLLA